MISVLHFVSNISKTNGMMNVIMNYFRNIDKSDIRFGFLYFDEIKDNFLDEILALGGEVYKVPRPSQFIAYRNAILELASSVQNKYEILHVHEFFMAILLKEFQKKSKIEKMVVHAHVTKFSDGNTLSAIRNWLLSRFNWMIADFFMASSKSAGRAIFGKVFNKKGVVINNAISIKDYCPEEEARNQIRKKYSLEDSFVVGHVGSMYPPKNHLFILDVFFELLKIRDDVRLLLVGDGELRESVEKKCKELGIFEHVIFTGRSSDVKMLMRAMDVFIFPSIFEGLGIALIEAQAAGLPCVYSDSIPEEADIVKNQNAKVSLGENAATWAKKLLEVRSSVSYQEVVKLMSGAGYIIEEEAEKLEIEYKKVLGINM